VSSLKTDKELAFLQDLFIAPDWGERFAELIDEHVPLPNEGRALYAAAGTGSHAMALQERGGSKLSLLCVDENSECIELAQAKATAINEQIEFRIAKLDNLDLPDNRFDLVVGNASLVSRSRVRKMFSEMVRVAAPGATIALALPTASSFGEFFSIYWEALQSSDLQDHGVDVEQLITELPTVADVEKMAAHEGLDGVTSWTAVEEFDYESGEQFINSPLITHFLSPGWLAPVPESARARVLQELARIIDEERHSGEFALSVKATLVAGTKARVQ
jgi:ubiquinone/menaquinone biosynthesis C-methylase UbiE